MKLLELHSGRLSPGAGLKPSQDGSDLVLTLLLHPAANTSPEEDLGVAQPELVLLQFDNVHHSLAGRLVVLGLGHGRRSQDVVSGFELWVANLVGEASTANGNTRKHTIALVLVHYEAWSVEKKLLTQFSNIFSQLI